MKVNYWSYLTSFVHLYNRNTRTDLYVFFAKSTNVIIDVWKYQKSLLFSVITFRLITYDNSFAQDKYQNQYL